MSEKALKGGCLCGAVTFELSPPLTALYLCHCTRCRKATGTGHASNMRAAPEQLRWLSGEALIGRFKLPGAKRFGKWFCTQCGSPLPRVIPEANVAVIPAGALDDPLPPMSRSHIFWDSRAAWTCEPGALPVHPGAPPMT